MNRARDQAQSGGWNDPYGELFRAWASIAMEALAQGRAAGLSPARREDRGTGTPRQLIELVAQAHLASSSAFMRCWNRALQSWTEYGRAAAGAASAFPEGLDDAALAKLVDEARAHVRRLGEIALDEARLFNAQMEALGEHLRACAEDPPAQGSPRRRARAKP